EHASRSLLLEIAKEPEPEAQIALWKEAQGGQLTVKKARERKLRDRKPAAPRCDIFLEQATVTIHFKTQGAGPTDVILALRDAMEEYLKQNASVLAAREEAPVSEAAPVPHDFPTNGHHPETEPELVPTADGSS